MEELFKYDTSIYDKYSYKREIIREQVKIDKYDKLYIPTVVQCSDDMGDDNIENKCISEKIICDEFYEIIKAYYKYPHPNICLYDPDELREYTIQTCRDLVDVSREEPNIGQLIYFIPILYHKHYPTKWDDNMYIHIMIYCNIVDPGASLLSLDNNYYMVLKLPMETNIRDHLFNMTDDIFGNDLSKINSLRLLSARTALSEIISSCDIF